MPRVASAPNPSTGMAVPVDTVKGMVNQILQYGRVVRPTLGVTLAPPQVWRGLAEQHTA